MRVKAKLWVPVRPSKFDEGIEEAKDLQRCTADVVVGQQNICLPLIRVSVAGRAVTPLRRLQLVSDSAA